MNVDYIHIIEKFYGKEDSALKRILLVHSRAVAQKALRIVDAHPEMALDRQFVEEAAMLHDIGIIRCDAPGIECFGTEPYIRHGILGAAMLRSEGLERHARVCERHTGAGLSRQDIVSQNLPLPQQDTTGLSARNPRRTAHLLCRQVFLEDTSRAGEDHRSGRA